ncbi:hypothetical protein CERSUDRAFT_86374 [Gelatoporia subvermispora B]|uniref:Uncharacterized protein n=1 Tax=Ceriporiopsis subvermispora (strain B) TaxID=914234 RepID=M2QB74_CERS8|nr:hypothetical protein CERSUDRAFT_86374 [Gelatoporia subvermispora B]
MYSVVSKFAGFVLVLANAFAAPAPAPRFETILSGPISIGDLSLIAGPFGSRLSAPVLSGNLSDTSGNLVATVVPNTSADDGVVSASGTFFPDAKATLQWIVDGELAYLHMQGVGELGVSDLTYV